MAFQDVLASAYNTYLHWELMYVKSVPGLETILADLKVIYGACRRRCVCRCTALCADNVELAVALITDLILADARFYSQHNLVLLQKAVIKVLVFFLSDKLECN